MSQKLEIFTFLFSPSFISSYVYFSGGGSHHLVATLSIFVITVFKKGARVASPHSKQRRGADQGCSCARLQFCSKRTQFWPTSPSYLPLSYSYFVLGRSEVGVADVLTSACYPVISFICDILDHSLSLWPYSPVNLGRSFRSSILYRVFRITWAGDQPVARPLHTHRTTQI
jgi:hypothetical protein